MGWTQYPDTHLTYAQEKAEMTRICAPWPVLQASKVGSTWYLAVQNPHDVFAVVVLVNQKGGFAYKDMDETMGPVEARAPASLIKKLTGPDTSGWRARCLKNAAHLKIKTGDKIVLLAPAIFGELRLTEFTAATYETRGKTRKCFHNPQIGLCRLGAYALEGATIA